MAIHGKATGILIGPYNPTSYLKQFDVSRKTDTSEATPFMVNAKQYVVGQSDATVTLSGFWTPLDPSVDALFENITILDSGAPFLVAYGGWKPGNRCRIGVTKRTGFDISAPVSDVASISGNLQADGGVRDGYLLSDPTAAVTATGNTAPIVSPPAGLNGVVRVQVHVVANTRNTATAFQVQTSNDGATWVDAYDFPNVSAGVSAAMVALVPLTRPQIRILVTPTAGTGSLSYAAAVATN